MGHDAQYSGLETEDKRPRTKDLELRIEDLRFWDHGLGFTL